MTFMYGEMVQLIESTKMEELITIATFPNAVNAHLLKSRLEAEGIRCYLHDEIMNTLDTCRTFWWGKSASTLARQFTGLLIFITTCKMT
jgi:hypothetical protein